MKTLRKLTEFIGFPLALIIFCVTHFGFAFFEIPTLGIGLLEFIPLGLVKVLFASGVAWLLMRLLFPEHYKALDEFRTDVSGTAIGELSSDGAKKLLAYTWQGVAIYFGFLLTIIISML